MSREAGDGDAESTSSRRIGLAAIRGALHSPQHFAHEALPPSPRVNPFLKYLALAFLMAAPASADVVYYEGRLSVDGVPFAGTGRFKFALVGGQGAALWSSGDISLTVSDGVYAVRLGESVQAPPIDSAVLRGTPPPKLRIWFHRDGKGWVVAGADVPLTSKPVTPAKPQ
jgi:hypothetical protein